jgi:hypothetical protein
VRLPHALFAVVALATSAGCLFPDLDALGARGEPGTEKAALDRRSAAPTETTTGSLVARPAAATPASDESTTPTPAVDDAPVTPRAAPDAGAMAPGFACYVSCISVDAKAVQLDKCSIPCKDVQCDNACNAQVGCSNPETCAPLNTILNCAGRCGFDLNAPTS